MDSYAESINEHYGKPGLLERMYTFLAGEGKDVNTLTCDDLTAFDEFHIGGRGETRNLARLVNVHEGVEILDVGSGVGGPARTLAGEFAARVTGLDITEEFCRVARELTERVGLSDNITFHQGSAMEMPFDDERFDVVWTQFAAMNINDRHALYREMFRVLRPGGSLAIHEVMGASDKPMKFPVLWAADPSISFVKPARWVRNELAATGFREKLWNDLTESSIRWFEEMKGSDQGARSRKARKTLSGSENFSESARNVMQNLKDGAINVVQTIWEKP